MQHILRIPWKNKIDVSIYQLYYVLWKTCTKSKVESTSENNLQSLIHIRLINLEITIYSFVEFVWKSDQININKLLRKLKRKACKIPEIKLILFILRDWFWLGFLSNHDERKFKVTLVLGSLHIFSITSTFVARFDSSWETNSTFRIVTVLISRMLCNGLNLNLSHGLSSVWDITIQVHLLTFRSSVLW